MSDLRQTIIDRATDLTEKDIADGDAPLHWTPDALAHFISDEKWLNGATHTCDLLEIAGTLNQRFKAQRDAMLAKEDEDGAECEEEGATLEAPNGTPWLLPISNMPGYEVDPFGVPHGVRRERAKGGPISLDKFFTSKGRKRGEGEKPRFVCGYRLRVDGKRKRYRPLYLIMARYFAEQKWLNGDES